MTRRTRKQSSACSGASLMALAVVTVAACGAGDSAITGTEATTRTTTPATTTIARTTTIAATTTIAPSTTIAATTSTIETVLPEVAPGTDLDFSFTLTTSAPPERVWAIWTDVENWPQWDILSAARIDGPFKLGAAGTVTNPDGSQAAFTVTDIVGTTSYEITLPLPDAAITIRRTLEAGSSTRFTHRVQFVGPNAQVFAEALAPGFRAALPRVMDSVRTIAES